MTSKLNLASQESGVVTVTQKGVQFPNGKIIWGDPDQENEVRIPELDGFASGRAVYRLDRTKHDTGDRYTVSRMNGDYARMIQKAQDEILAPIDVEDYPRIVARSIMLAIGETEQL